jgi:type I restriction enzyme S subunit
VNAPLRQREVVSSWPRVRLGEIAEHRLGKMLDREKNTGVPRRYLRNPNVRWFDVDLSGLQEILVEEKDVHKYELQYGDVIICEGGEAGRAALWKNEAKNVIFQKAIHRVRVGPKLDARFLIHRLMFDYFNGGLEDYHTGATIKHFTGQDLARYEIPLPPIEEQRRIAAILDKADALRRKRKRALDLLDSLAQSIFLEMFGDQARNCKDWKERPLADFESFLTSGSRGWAKYYSDSGKVFIRIQNLQKGELSTSELQHVDAPDNAEARRTTVRSGDVLISITADLGRTAVVPDALDRQAHINQHIALVRTKGINPTYLSTYLASPAGQLQFDALNRQGVKAGLNFDNIRSLKILEPPLALQERYANIWATIKTTSVICNREAVVSRALFSSLQSRAFSGQL